MKPTGPFQWNFSMFATTPAVAYLFLVRLQIRLLAATLLISAFNSIAASEDQPWAIDKPLESPSHSFSVVQHRDGDWSTTVHFERIHAPDFTFTEIYPWPALFYFSPHHRWHLPIHNSLSAHTLSFFFH